MTTLDKNPKRYIPLIFYTASLNISCTRVRKLGTEPEFYTAHLFSTDTIISHHSQTTKLQIYSSWNFRLWSLLFWVSTKFNILIIRSLTNFLLAASSPLQSFATGLVGSKGKGKSGSKSSKSNKSNKGKGKGSNVLPDGSTLLLLGWGQNLSVATRRWNGTNRSSCRDFGRLLLIIPYPI